MTKRKEQQLDLIEKKATHGGARKGAGRKPSGVDTKVMRVPVNYVTAIKELVRFLDEHSNEYAKLEQSYESDSVYLRASRSHCRLELGFSLESHYDS